MRSCLSISWRIVGPCTASGQGAALVIVYSNKLISGQQGLWLQWEACSQNPSSFAGGRRSVQDGRDGSPNYLVTPQSFLPQAHPQRSASKTSFVNAPTSGSSDAWGPATLRMRTPSAARVSVPERPVGVADCQSSIRHYEIQELFHEWNLPSIRKGGFMESFS